MIPVLLAATATKWFGTARIPRALVDAGFEVTLFAPRGSIAERSRFVKRTAHLPDDATPRQWLQAFAQVVHALRPALVLPADDMAFQLLQGVATEPPADLHPELRSQLGQLAETSLGDPAFYRASVDKTALASAAERLGVRVPRYAIVRSPAEAQVFAAQAGYPLVVRRAHGWGGKSAAFARDPASLAEAFRSLDPWTPQPMFAPSPDRIVQERIPGSTYYYAASAWRGRLLAGWAAEKLIANPAPTGPATVLRYRRMPELAAFSERLVEGFGMTGLFGIEYIVDDRDGRGYLVEINRRVTPGLHKGAPIGVDLCGTLHAALVGRPPDARRRIDLEEGEEYISVNFPQEWLRDPTSEWMRRHPVDAPWDDPDLLHAMLDLRHE